MSFLHSSASRFRNIKSGIWKCKLSKFRVCKLRLRQARVVTFLFAALALASLCLAHGGVTSLHPACLWLQTIALTNLDLAHLDLGIIVIKITSDIFKCCNVIFCEFVCSSLRFIKFKFSNLALANFVFAILASPGLGLGCSDFSGSIIYHNTFGVAQWNQEVHGSWRKGAKRNPAFCAGQIR